MPEAELAEASYKNATKLFSFPGSKVDPEAETAWLDPECSSKSWCVLPLDVACILYVYYSCIVVVVVVVYIIGLRQGSNQKRNKKAALADRAMLPNSPRNITLVLFFLDKKAGRGLPYIFQDQNKVWELFSTEDVGKTTASKTKNMIT